MKQWTALALVLALLLACLPGGAQETYTTLQVGATGAQVTKLQQRLIDAGFLSTAADGKYGEGTGKAVRALQQALKDRGHNLAVDGIAGAVTQQLLYDDTAMAPFLDFGTGATGPRVLRLQTRLIDLKFLSGAADGAFGQQTLQALTAFQEQLFKHQAAGIQVNGLADEATRTWLEPDADLSAFAIIAPEFFDDSQPLTLSEHYLNAKSAILVDADSGRILFAKEMEARLYPASTTKMMTLLLAVERGHLDEQVTLPEVTGEVPRDSSLVPVYAGEKMSMRDLLYGLMIRSGNDAANAIAQICAGSVDKFVQQMNARAAQLGMENTVFQNPHGYHHKEHVSTAKDLAILALYGMRNPDFAAIATALRHELPATTKRKALTLFNSNELLSPGNAHYYPDALGIKSGYTSAAGFCYVGAATREGRTLIAVIMGSRTRNRGWDDMARLFNYGFAQKGQ